MANGKQSNKNVRYLILAISFFLAFLFVVVPPIRSSVAIYLVFCVLSYLIYSSRDYQNDLSGLDTKGALLNGFYGFLFGIAFIILSSVIPFFSLAFPRFPGAIADSLKAVLVIGVAPPIETIFFIGAMYAFFRNMNKDHKYIYIILVSFFFACFHLASYILGFYTLSGAEGLTAITSNISAFITAFIFNFVAMFFGLRNGITKSNIIFYWVFHTVLNVFAFGLAVITFL